MKYPVDEFEFNTYIDTIREVKKRASPSTGKISILNTVNFMLIDPFMLVYNILQPWYIGIILCAAVY